MTGTFRRSDAGTAAAAWPLEDVGLLPVPYPGDRVVVLAAHPDDETLGAGGAIAALTRRGVDVAVVIATDGEASHPDSPTHTPADLSRIRRTEVSAALGRLGAGEHLTFLALPDGGLTDHRDELRARVAALAAGATHLISTWTGDRHPDHEVCGEVAADIAGEIGARHWQYPVWAWHWADPAAADLPVELLRRLPLTPADRAAKQGALAAHLSQHSPLSHLPGDEEVLAASFLEHFTRDAEYFIAVGAEATSPAAFDALYERLPDPWDLNSSLYEQRKRDLEFASLPRERFHRAFEPGCALGLLTERLAARCDEVVAWDVTARCLDATRARVAGATHVLLERRGIPDDWPAGEFDLLMLSEVGYYCVDLELLVRRVLDSLAPDGVLLACHFRRPAPDHPHTAEAVHHALGTAGLRHVAGHVEDDFLLDVWTRSPQRPGTVA